MTARATSRNYQNRIRTNHVARPGPAAIPRLFCEMEMYTDNSIELRIFGAVRTQHGNGIAFRLAKDQFVKFSEALLNAAKEPKPGTVSL